MIRLAWKLSVADARRAPARAGAVAALLVVAVWLPETVDAPALLGVLIAVAAAFSAVVGSVGLAESRIAVLEHNGARPGLQALTAVASVLSTGLVAFVTAEVVAVVLGTGPAVTAAAMVTLAVPVVTAPVAAWLTGRNLGRRRMGFDGLQGWRRKVAIAGLVVACVAFAPLGVVVVAGWLASGAWSKDRLRRALALGLATLALVMAVVVIGSSTDWWDLSLALSFMIPVLMVAVAIVAVHVHAAATHRGEQLGPWFRLALAPLALRRRVLAPLLALVTLSLTIAVTEGVVGASFGRREADRSDTLPSVTAVAGNSARQAIVPVGPVDPEALRTLLHDQLAGTGASAVVIDQVGVGDTTSILPNRDWANAPFTVALLTVSASDLPTVSLAGGGPGDQRARWIGVVSPGDLGLLGWQGSALSLAQGKVVLVAPSKPWVDGTVTLDVGRKKVRRDATAVAGRRGGYALPGALVSDATAAALSPVVTTARVVVVPTPGAAAPPTTAQLIAHGRAIQRAVARLPMVHPDGFTKQQQSQFELLAEWTAPPPDGSWVVSGDDRVTIWESGPLNAVPGLAGTAREARRSALPLIALCVLATLAVVFLALGATRRDDEVLRMQGARGRLRSSIAAIQAGVVTVAAAIVAALLGIGLPAACFAVYNRGADLPPIPLVVPAFVWAVLIGVPVGTAALAALVPLFRRRGSPAVLSDSTDLLW